MIKISQSLKKLLRNDRFSIYLHQNPKTLKQVQGDTEWTSFVMLNLFQHLLKNGTYPARFFFLMIKISQSLKKLLRNDWFEETASNDEKWTSFVRLSSFQGNPAMGFEPRQGFILIILPFLMIRIASVAKSDFAKTSFILPSGLSPLSSVLSPLSSLLCPLSSALCPLSPALFHRSTPFS